MQLPNGASRLVFILAHPAGHVGAPKYYSPYFWENGLDWHMVPMDVAPRDLTETLRTLARSKSVVGFNLTRQLWGGIDALHSHSGAMKHEPSALLSYADGAVNLP